MEEIEIYVIKPGNPILDHQDGLQRYNIQMPVLGGAGSWIRVVNDTRYFLGDGDILVFDYSWEHAAGFVRPTAQNLDIASDMRWLISIGVVMPNFDRVYDQIMDGSFGRERIPVKHAKPD